MFAAVTDAFRTVFAADCGAVGKVQPITECAVPPTNVKAFPPAAKKLSTGATGFPTVSLSDPA
jgi:hypothetical protein